MKQPVLLCYNVREDAFRRLRLAAMRLKIRVRPVRPWELRLPVGQLCETAAAAEGTPDGDAFSDEMLVLAYFPTGLGSAFLQLMRKSGVPPIALKAMLTPTNSQWDSLTLHDEMLREREAILSGGESAHSVQ